MPRLNQDGVSLRHVLAYLTNSDVSDADIARALDMPVSSHQNRKQADDYPSFSELAILAEHYGLSATMLQIAFGWRSPDEMILLQDEEMDQYVQQGGGVSPLVSPTKLKARTPTTAVKRSNKGLAVDKSKPSV